MFSCKFFKYHTPHFGTSPSQQIVYFRALSVVWFPEAYGFISIASAFIVFFCLFYWFLVCFPFCFLFCLLFCLGIWSTKIARVFIERRRPWFDGWTSTKRKNYKEKINVLTNAYLYFILHFKLGWLKTVVEVHYLGFIVFLWRGIFCNYFFCASIFLLKKERNSFNC